MKPLSQEVPRLLIIQVQIQAVWLGSLVVSYCSDSLHYTNPRDLSRFTAKNKGFTIPTVFSWNAETPNRVEKGAHRKMVLFCCFLYSRKKDNPAFIKTFPCLPPFLSCLVLQCPEYLLFKFFEWYLQYFWMIFNEIFHCEHVIYCIWKPRKLQL